MAKKRWHKAREAHQHMVTIGHNTERSHRQYLQAMRLHEKREKRDREYEKRGY